jgi:hypothetical protein
LARNTALTKTYTQTALGLADSSLALPVVSWRLPHVAPLYAAVDVACVRNALGGEAQLNVREHV